MKLFIAPHDDDQVLFGAFTLIREKPLVAVVTDSWLQWSRDNDITADQRWQETVEAMKILDCAAIRLGIRDDVIEEWAVKDKLSRFVGFDEVYAPAIQDGNPHHDLVGRIAQELFGDKVKRYATYTKDQFFTPGTIEIKPTPEELELKNKALACFITQINYAPTKGHFEAVKNLSEWLI